MIHAKLSLITIFTWSSFVMAGGDLIPVVPYKVEDVEASKAVEVTTPPTSKNITSVSLSDVDESPFYVGFGITSAQYKTTCNCSGINSITDKTLGAVVKIGYDFNKYLGMEARGFVTPVKSDGSEIQHYGSFIKPIYSVTDRVNAYGLCGLAKTKTKGSLKNVNVSGLAFGAGVEYAISRESEKEVEHKKGFGVFADYERLYYKKNSVDLDTLSVGVTYGF